MNANWKPWGAAACALVLAGCHTVPTSSGVGVAAGNPDCPDSAGPPIPEVACLQGGVACGISVKVVPGAGGACRVEIGTDVLRMRRNPGAPGATTEIFWWLAGSDKWELRADGTPPTAPVIFKDSGASSQFTAARVFLDGRVAYIHNRNTDKKRYDYTIRVYNKATGRPLESPDPAIFNDGP